MDIFNLPPGHSERDIKRAYAKALKKIDIDENPDEFQQLHNAYQHALLDFEEQQRKAESQPLEDTQTGCADADSMEASRQLDAHLHEANHNNNETVESFEQAQESLWQMPEGEGDNEQEQTIESHWEPEESNETSPEEASLSEEQEATAQHYQQQLELLDQKLEQLLAMPKECKQLYPWLFLNEFPELNDYDFWIEASRLVYHRIADSQSPEYTGKRPDITREVLAFLDSIFNWFEYLQDPEEPAYNHHQTLYNRVQDLHGVVPAEHDAKPHRDSKPERSKQVYGLLAFIADAFILIAIFGLFYTLLEGSFIHELYRIEAIPIAAFAYYVATILSPMQATLGQTMANYKVVTLTGERPSFMDSVRRGSGLFVALICVVALRLFDEHLSAGVTILATWGIIAFSYFSWKKLNRTKLIETTLQLEDHKAEKEIFPYTILAGVIDFFFLFFVIDALHKDFSGRFPALFDPLLVPIVILLYYISMVASPLQGTIGQLVFRYRVVDMQGGRLSPLDTIKRASGFICLSIFAYLAYWNQAILVGKYEWQLTILFPTIAFFIWKYFNKSLLVPRSSSTPPN